MSRGLGKKEREILHEINEHGMLLINDPRQTTSETSSRHRAAKSLERKGLIGIIQSTTGGRTRNIALTVKDAERVRQNEQRRETRKMQEEYLRLQKALGIHDDNRKETPEY